MLIFNEEENKDSFGHELTQKFCHLSTTEEYLRNYYSKLTVAWRRIACEKIK